MPFSLAAYTQTVTARLVEDGFYRYPTEDAAIKAFASLNTDGTDVMVGDTNETKYCFWKSCEAEIEKGC